MVFRCSRRLSFLPPIFSPVIGFFWTFAMKFPHSVQSLHLRRCVLDAATHVAIAVTDPEADDNEVTFEFTYIHGLRRFFSSFFQAVSDVMTFLFSDKNTFGCPRSSNGRFTMVPVLTDADDGSTRYIVFRFRRYNLCENLFVPGMLQDLNYVKDIVAADSSSGLAASQIKAKRRVVGENSITMEKPSFLRCLKREFSKPFYTYQTFMVWAWFPLWYYYMAFTWMALIITAALVVTYFQFRNESNLYKITEIVGDVKVVRDGETKTIPHQELVPGDIVHVEDGIAFCDMVLVSSKNLLVDESALTGEANYVGKVAIDPNIGNDEYDIKKHKRSSVFAGTTILESDETRAIVTKTSSFTARGEMIRDIYSFNRHQFKFDVEVPIVITILFFYAIFAFFITNYFIGDQWVYGFFYGMYVVNSALPPLLPTVFTVSVGVSDDRLARKRVACTNSESILVAGKVTRAFFDKTGTLTNQGLDFLSVRSANDWQQVNTKDQSQSFMSDRLATGMAVCHTLTRSSKNGTLVGNPVDRVMFDASGATFTGETATDKHGLEMTIVKQFDFDHHRMTQSTVVKTPDGSLIAYVKGSGENIKALCQADSMPSDFDSALRESAKQGIYQISIAFKLLASDTNVATVSRGALESELIFLGVVNFKNTMRDESPEVIRHLRQGNVESIMVTGDSILTGIKIARESGILTTDEPVLVGSLNTDADHATTTHVVWKSDSSHEDQDLPSVATLKASGTKLAMSGEAFSYLRSTDPTQAVALMDSIRVYGRCTPNDKVAVVSIFVKQGHITMMCGDGGNDCGALKTAHVGVALSDAEASTVAPFTSLDKTLTSVVDVLLEGRCALASAMASYKYIIMYGQVETLLQILCAYFAITFAEWNWVFMDGVWTVCLAFALPLARAATRLSPTRPTASILGLVTLASACGILLINFLFQIGALAYLWNQDWFACRKWENADLSNVLVIGDNYESEVLFLVGGFQYIHSAAAFNFGFEFRRNWFANYILVALVIGYSVIQIYIAFVPGDLSCIWRVNCINENVRKGVTEDKLPIQNVFNTTVMPDSFQRGIVGLMIANAMVIMGYEYFVVNGIRRHYANKKRQTATAAGTKQSAEEDGDKVEMAPPLLVEEA
jgi:predicted P-type ATPase